MPYANNALSKEIRRNKRKHFIDVAMKSKQVIDFLTFDISSYFRVQFVVMFGLNTVPFNLREFVLATYYLQKTGQKAYAKRVHDLCPHIKRTTIANMEQYGLIKRTGKWSTGHGRHAETFELDFLLYERMEMMFAKADYAIRDKNRKERNKAKKHKENTPESTTEIDTISSFLDSSEFDFLE
jgi:hypothetical protein